MAGTTTIDKLIYQIEVEDEGASKAFDAWDKRLKDSKKRTEKSFKGLAKSVSSAFDKIPQMLSKAFLGIAKSLTGAVLSAVGQLKDAFVGLGVSAVTNAIDLQDAMNGVKRTAGLTTAETARLTQSVRDYAVANLDGFGTAIQIAEAIEIAGQQGIRGEENMLAFAGAMVKASVALDGMDIGKLSEKLGIFHGVFKGTIPTIENAASVLNHFGNTTKRGAGFILDLASKMAGGAAAFGLTEQETLALAAALGSVPQVASASGRAFSRVMGSLRTDTLAWGEALGWDTQQAQDFSRLVREDASLALVAFGREINNLTKTEAGTDKLLQAFKDMSFTGDGVRAVLLGLGSEVDALGSNLEAANTEWEKNTSLQEEFEGSTERVSAAWKSLNEVWGNTIGMVGDVLLPHIEVFLLAVKEIVKEFRVWFKESNFLTEVLPAAMKEINAVLLMMLDRVVDIAKNIDWSAVFTKVGTVIKSVWEKVKGLVEALSTGEFTTQWNELVDAMKAIIKVITGVGKVLKGLFDIAKPGLSKFAESIQYAIETIKEMDSLWDIVTGTIKIFANTAKNAILGVIGTVKALATSLWEATKAVVGLGKEATEESTFPDMYRWILRDIDSIRSLAQGVQQATHATAALGNATARAQSFQPAPSTRAPISRQPSGPVTRQASESTPTPTPAGGVSGGGGPTIVFNGPNIVDESSKDRFARQITKKQNDLWGHVVFG